MGKESQGNNSMSRMWHVQWEGNERFPNSFNWPSDLVVLRTDYVLQGKWRDMQHWAFTQSVHWVSPSSSGQNGRNICLLQGVRGSLKFRRADFSCLHGWRANAIPQPFIFYLVICFLNGSKLHFSFPMNGPAQPAGWYGLGQEPWALTALWCQDLPPPSSSAGFQCLAIWWTSNNWAAKATEWLTSDLLYLRTSWGTQ